MGNSEDEGRIKFFMEWLPYATNEQITGLSLAHLMKVFDNEPQHIREAVGNWSRGLRADPPEDIARLAYSVVTEFLEIEPTTEIQWQLPIPPPKRTAIAKEVHSRISRRFPELPLGPLGDAFATVDDLVVEVWKEIAVSEFHKLQSGGRLGAGVGRRHSISPDGRVMSTLPPDISLKTAGPVSTAEKGGPVDDAMMETKKGDYLERIPLTFEHSPRGERSFCILVG
jgi:hypothetical protein